MEFSRYHWVGALSGVPLFSGAWLSAYYNNVWPGIIGLVIAGVGIFVANRVERRSDVMTDMQRGAIAGVLAAVVARVLGWFASMFAGVSQGVSFDSFGDLWRVVLGGGWAATFVLLVAAAIVGAAIAALEPEAKGEK